MKDKLVSLGLREFRYKRTYGAGIETQFAHVCCITGGHQSLSLHFYNFTPEGEIHLIATIYDAMSAENGEFLRDLPDVESV